MENEDLGYAKGEKCNRNGCEGILLEHASDRGCSCHINPPCSYCTDAREYCNECGWEGREEQIDYEKEQAKKYSTPEYQESFRLERLEQDERDKAFWDMVKGKAPRPTELVYRNSSHTHFSMIKEGVYPADMPFEKLYQQIQGTFGGRFEIHNKETGHFKFIAYTD